MKSIRWYDEKVDDLPEDTEDARWAFDVRLSVGHRNLNHDKMNKIDSLFNAFMSDVEKSLKGPTAKQLKGYKISDMYKKCHGCPEHKIIRDGEGLAVGHQCRVFPKCSKSGE